MSQKIVYPRYIETSPCGEDLFESGSQNRLATSIAEHIKKPTSNYRLLGLDGGWGGGKSNVISIINKLLKDTHHVFVYDAWSHQEDQQRRSFLEELTDNLQQAELVNQEAWTVKLNDLLAKKKQTTQKTVPRLSLPIIFVFLATLLIPVSLSVAIAFKCWWQKLLIAASPLLIIFIVWIIAAAKNKKYRNFSELFLLYKQKELETTTNETISEIEPSVREFRNWMIDVEKSLTKRKLIIVFDNMDRLSPDRVQALWSSIHTFFAEANQHEHIWVIVPFDRSHISAAFGDNLSKADHFINKTFSVIFRVPPAVLTDWWNFFELKFNDAFGTTEQSEFNIVKNIFDRYQTAITPRTIIAFINELVSLKIIWGKEIKLRYMALFLVNRQEILNDPVNTIISKSYREKVTEYFQDDEEVDACIAALVYNVSKESASQVTLQREIVLAVRGKDVPYLQRLSSHKDFFKILEDIYNRQEIELDASAFSLDKIELLDDNNNGRYVLEAIWNKLVYKQKSLPIDELKFTEIQQILLKHCTSFNRPGLIRHLAAQYAVSRNMKGEGFFKAIHGLDEYIVTNNWDLKLSSLVSRTQMQPQDFIEYLRAANDLHEKYNVYCDNFQLDTHLVDKFAVDWAPFEIVKFIRNEYKFPLLQDRVEKQITENSVPLDNVPITMEIYRDICEERLLPEKMADAHVEALATSSVKKTPAYYELVAMRLARADAWQAGSGVIAMYSDADDETITEVSTRIESYADLGTLFQGALNWHDPLLCAVLKNIIENPKPGSSLHLITILPLLDQLCERIGVSEIKMINKLSEFTDQLKKDLNEQNLKEVINSQRIYVGCLANENEFSAHVWNIAKSFTINIEEEQWAELLKDEGCYELILLNNLLKTKILRPFPRKLVEPYKRHLLSMAKHGGNKQHDKKLWDTLFAHIESSELTGVAKNIRDGFLTQWQITPQLFSIFEGMLREHSNLYENPEAVFRRIVTPMIEDKACFELITENLDFYFQLFEQAGNEKVDFIRALRRAVKNNRKEPALSFEHKITDYIKSRITILEGKYYTTEHSFDVTEKLRQVIEVEKTLQFKIDNGIVDGEDPHSGVVKNLFIRFQFDGREMSQEYKEGEQLNIP